MELTRREALKKIGIGGLVLVGGHIVNSNFSKASLAYASDADKWKQFAGSKIVFMSEDTPPTAAIKAKIQPFLDLTGIEIEIKRRLCLLLFPG
jgi:multiple sugar transport system substrate-binding protein